MNKWERTYTKGDMPLYMYKISEFMVNKFGKTNCEKGISVEGIVLRDSWTTFEKEQRNLNDLLYDKDKNGKGYIDYRIYITNTNNVVKESIYKDALEMKIKDEINKEIDKEIYTGYSV